MENEIVNSIPVIAMKRYIKVQVIIIKGLDNINTFLEKVKYGNIIDLKNNFGMKSLEKFNGVELIQLNNSLSPEGEVVALATMGIITMACIDREHELLYKN